MTDTKGTYTDLVSFEGFEIKDADDGTGDLVIMGTAVSTDISNDHRFPRDFLKGDKSLVGVPVIDCHSDLPWGPVKTRDIYGKITKQSFEDGGKYPEKSEKDKYAFLAGKGRGKLKFTSRIWDANQKRVIREFPSRIKFSVGFKHDWETETYIYKNEEGQERIKKVRVTKTGQFDHLGIVQNPADKSAVPDKSEKNIKSNEETKKEAKIMDEEMKAAIAKQAEELKAQHEAALKEMEEKHKAESEKLETDRKALQEKNDQLTGETDTLKTQTESLTSQVTDAVAQVKLLAEAETVRVVAEKKASIEIYVDEIIEKGLKTPAMRDSAISLYTSYSEEQMKAEKEMNEALSGSIFEEEGRTQAGEKDEHGDPVPDVKLEDDGWPCIT